MRVSVIEETDDKLRMNRWTARTTDGGRLIFCDYDELVRETTYGRFRVKRAWRENQNDAKYMREDGVEVLPKPTMLKGIKDRLLAAARAQLEWARED